MEVDDETDDEEKELDTSEAAKGKDTGRSVSGEKTNPTKHQGEEEVKPGNVEHTEGGENKNEEEKFENEKDKIKSARASGKLGQE